jgi:hypothetical protein
LESCTPDHCPIKIGRRPMRNGAYELIDAPQQYPGRLYRGKYAYEHRVVWWKETGEIPGKDEVVHHKNGDKRDNTFENLELLSREEHKKLHGERRKANMVSMMCPVCNKEFIKARRKTHLVKPNGATFCSRSCAATASNKDRKFETEVLAQFRA